MDNINIPSSTTSDDRLGDHLRRAAMDERPAFSPELHRQITERLEADARWGRARSRIGLWLGAAAVVLLTSGLFFYMRIISPSARLNFATTPHEKSSPPKPQVREPSAELTDQRAVDQDGSHLISARLWPPALMVQLPLPGRVETSNITEDSSSPPPPTVALPGSPRWLLSALQAPEDRALSSIRQSLPAKLGELLLERQQDLQ